MDLQIIQERIYTIRGQKIMLDYDLAELYEVETRVLNQAVRRNAKRFPTDFMFRLTETEWQRMSSQIVMTYPTKRPKVAIPYAFTEQGLAMLSGVLNSDKAIDVNIAIMRAFVMLRKMVLQHKEIIDRIDQLEASYDEKFAEVFKALKYLLEPPQTEREAIGFKRGN